MDLRKQAQGRECQIRIPGICNGNSETVVLCHLNNKGLFGAGTGMKVPDMFGAYGCSSCHTVVDNGQDTRQHYASGIEKMFYEGCFRTMNILLREGKIKI